MNANDYQKLAMRTCPVDKLSASEMLVNAALGICGEGGEVADLVKKHRFQGHELDRERILKEFGDVLWYVAEGCTSFGVTLGEIMEMNIEKLRKRYPDGFDADRSIHREEGDV